MDINLNGEILENYDLQQTYETAMIKRKVSGTEEEEEDLEILDDVSLFEIREVVCL